MSFLTTTLVARHEKARFGCGKPMLDSYLHKQANQDIKRKLSACFVLEEGNLVKGYYTLSTASVDRNQLPTELMKKLPPTYHELPMTLLGRLAVNKAHQGLGLGETLLMDALKRCLFASLEVGSMAVIVDPIDTAAVRFYQQYGFVLLPDSGKMFLSMSTIAALFV